MRFKVGDRVRIKSLDWYNENKDKNGHIECGTATFDVNMQIYCGSITTIYAVDEIGYDLDIDWGQNVWTDEMIERLVEEEIREVTDKYYWEMLGGENNNEINLPEGYIFKDENGNIINTTKIVLEKKKKEYPKTYEECCVALEYIPHTDDIIGYKWNIFQSLQKLLICRDAYWKIAGEEMGLGKPWKPDWNDGKWKWCMSYSGNYIEFDQYKSKHHTLAFPTEEMRDAFYENFKEEIESVKELL